MGRHAQAGKDDEKGEEAVNVPKAPGERSTPGDGDSEYGLADFHGCFFHDEQPPVKLSLPPMGSLTGASGAQSGQAGAPTFCQPAGP
jgi:hypothetical protein